MRRVEPWRLSRSCSPGRASARTGTTSGVANHCSLRSRLVRARAAKTRPPASGPSAARPALSRVRPPRVAPNRRTRDILWRLISKRTPVALRPMATGPRRFLSWVRTRVCAVVYMSIQVLDSRLRDRPPGIGRARHRNDTRVLDLLPPPPEPVGFGTMPQPVNARLHCLSIDAGR